MQLGRGVDELKWIALWHETGSELDGEPAIDRGERGRGRVLEPFDRRGIRGAEEFLGPLVGEIGTSVVEHNAIIRAVESGSPDAAQRAVQTNWRNAAGRLGRVIVTMGEHGTWQDESG